MVAPVDGLFWVTKPDRNKERNKKKLIKFLDVPSEVQSEPRLLTHVCSYAGKFLITGSYFTLLHLLNNKVSKLRKW